MQPSSETIILPYDQSIDFVYVEGGEFLMGDDDEIAHRVKLASFHISKYPVTQSVWQAIIGGYPSHFTGENRPVENVSWNQVQDFIRQLSKETSKQFRLLTEAEWEYAARGGKYSQDYTYSGSDKLKQVGWYNENCNSKTHDVGMMLANELGLYDMSGNVWEWCEDWYDENYYGECKRRGVVENPTGPAKGGYRVIRGGSYFEQSLNCRPVSRGRDRPGTQDGGIGFRLVLRPQSEG